MALTLSRLEYLRDKLENKIEYAGEKRLSALAFDVVHMQEFLTLVEEAILRAQVKEDAASRIERL